MAVAYTASVQTGIEWNIGDSGSITRRVTEEDIRRCADLTGDYNPVHLDEEYAKLTRFRGRIAHGVICEGYISALLGTKIPGYGCILLEKDVRFLLPVRPDDEITATATIEDYDRERGRMRLKTSCFNQRNEEVLSGHAMVYYK